MLCLVLNALLLVQAMIEMHAREMIGLRAAMISLVSFASCQKDTELLFLVAVEVEARDHKLGNVPWSVWHT